MSDYEQLSDRAVRSEIRSTLEQDNGAGWISNVCSPIIPSDQASEVYRWLGQVPSMSEWVGSRSGKGLSTNEWTITNVHYESTLPVAAKDMRRDKTGMLMQRIGEMGERATTHWAKLVSPLILNGSATVCYDGQYFFDTDHAEGDSGAQSNKINVDISGLPAAVHGVVTAPSIEEMQQAIMKGISQMYSFVDDQGEPLNEMAQAFVVMVPPSLYIVASNAVSLPKAGEQNNFNLPGNLSVSVQANARMAAWTDKFVVLRADGMTKPFVRQQENDFEIEVLGPGSDHYFKHKEYLFGIDVWRAADYGLWQGACQVTMT